MGEVDEQCCKQCIFGIALKNNTNAIETSRRFLSLSRFIQSDRLKTVTLVWCGVAHSCDMLCIRHFFFRSVCASTFEDKSGGEQKKAISQNKTKHSRIVIATALISSNRNQNKLLSLFNQRFQFTLVNEHCNRPKRFL